MASDHENGSAPSNAHGTAQRLHRSSLLFLLIAHARTLIIPGLVVLWGATRGGQWEVWLMLAFVPVAVFEVVRWLTLRYRFAGDELIVSSGLIFRNERHIPLARIQSVDLVQGPLHRLFRVAEVRLQTASGEKPEAVLRVLAVPAVEAMRERIVVDRASIAPGAESAGVGAPEGDALITVPPGELVKLGVIVNRGAVAVAAAAGLAWEFGLYNRIDISELIDTGAHLSLARAMLFGALLVLCAFVALSLFSIAWTLLRLFGFTLRRSGDDLRISCGLLTRRLATVPRHRIQFISQVESPLHRLFRRVTVRVENAGSRGEGERDATLSQRWFVPLAARDEAARVIKAIDVGIDLDDAPWQPLAAGAVRRMRKKRVLLALLVAALPCVLLRPWGALAAPPLIAFAWWSASAEARYAAWARTSRAVYFRSGVLTRRRSATPLEKIQVVALHRSPFDRRWSMASIAVDTAGAGPAGHRVVIPYLDEATARELQEALAERSAESVFRW